MKRKPFGILCHAFQMVRRNIRSYAMLSVTIVLSFSILLGFMGYMDSEHYNTYKRIFALDRGLLRVSSAKLNASSANLLQQKAEEYGTTHTLQTLRYLCNLSMNQWRLPTGEKISGMHIAAYAVQRECWFLESDFGSSLALPYEVTWLDGRESRNITLEKGQILMDEHLYHALGLAEKNNMLQLQMKHSEYAITGDMTEISGAFQVIGTVSSSAPLEPETVTYESTGETYAMLKDTDYKPVLVFSLDDLNPNTLPGTCNRTVIFHSDQPENVRALIKNLEPNLQPTCVYESQNRALEAIRTEKGTKAIIAALLMLILGINLYSSFENALNDRKYEIGVKRAIGASGFSIIRQFFYESMIVMLANIALSVALVVDLGLLLKLYRQLTLVDADGLRHFDFETYTLYITPYSAGMFVACAVALTVVFSFVFAYKTTQVQIVDYLKAE